MALKTAALCALLTLAAPAQTLAPRQAVEQSYNSAAHAARLKYIFGMLHHRTADFEIFARDGRKFDLTVERDRFAKLFEPASQTRLDTRILSFQSRGDRVACRVEQTLKIEAPDPQTRAVSTTVVRSRQEDYWILRSGQWKLRATRLESQDFTQLPGTLKQNS